MQAGPWLRAAEAALPVVDCLAPEGEVLVIAPHPDDESLGCGGLIAGCAAAARAARIVVVSDGAASHPGSRLWQPARLAALRRGEAWAAAGALGLDPARDVLFLDLPDGAVPDTGRRFDEAVAAVLRFAAAAPPAVLVAAWRHDPHCDHAASFALARAVARALPAPPRLLAYPVWGLAHAHPIPGIPLPAPPDLTEPARGVRLDIRRHLTTKRRAIAAHASQMGRVVWDDPAGFVLPDALLRLMLRPFELFLEEAA